MKKWDWICDEVEEGREREGEQMTWWEKVFDEVEEEHKRKRKGRQTEDAGRKHQAKAANGDGGAGQQRTDGDGDRARGERKPKSRLIATPYLWRDPTTIKPRDFLYGDHIVRGYVTGLVSTGGVGKTSEIQVEIAAMLTGRELLGVKPKRAYRVWYINLEDPLEEIDRRMAAIFKHYGISEQDIAGC
jgi:AAA domain